MLYQSLTLRNLQSSGRVWSGTSKSAAITQRHKLYDARAQRAGGGASVWVLIGVGLLSRASRYYRRAERHLMTRNHPGVQEREIIPARNNHIIKNPKEHEHLDRQLAHSGWRPSYQREGGKTLMLRIKE